MPNIRNKFHFGRSEWIVNGKIEMGFEKSAFAIITIKKFSSLTLYLIKITIHDFYYLLESVWWSHYEHLPFVNVVVID